MSKSLSKKLGVIIGIVLMLCLLAGILVGCRDNFSKMSTDSLSITENLGNYDESAKKVEFAKEREICLAKDGESDYGIIIDATADEATIALADDLSAYLNRIIGSEGMFKVVKGGGGITPLPNKYISLGSTIKANDIGTDQLKDDGYLIKSVDGNIFIKTIDDSNLHNGVYSFLESQLECMFVRDDYDYVPSFPTIYLDNLDIVSNPDFNWRKMHQYEVAQNGWYKKLKNNGTYPGEVEAFPDWGTWCHTYFTFVDPAIYLEEHPEYFSIVDGEARQLCLTNPEVYPIIEANLQKRIEADTNNNKYWDFSLMDNRDYCKCKNCKKVLKETGSMMGTLLPIINKLARKFPDKIISTLAYYDNEKVPKGMECEPNVNIVIAPIQSGQMYSYNLDGSKQARDTKKLIESWGKVAQNILIWDYVTDFRHMLMPFPNFDVQKDNHDLYLANNVTAVFHQGSREANHELACLRSYVLSQQLWDNDVDINDIMAKYVSVTYGKGAKNVALYLDKCNSELKEKGSNLDLYDEPSWHWTDYLSSKNNKYYLELINEAIELEKGNEVIVSRLEEIKINILYAIMNEGGFAIGRKKAAFAEFRPLVLKHEVPQPYEASEPTMQQYIAKVYPRYLLEQKLALSACVIVPILGVAGIGTGMYFFLKWRKKKKNSQNITL